MFASNVQTFFSINIGFQREYNLIPGEVVYALDDTNMCF
jgi:hypothetical protein